jgi:hypothetical protein
MLQLLLLLLGPDNISVLGHILSSIFSLSLFCLSFTTFFPLFYLFISSLNHFNESDNRLGSVLHSIKGFPSSNFGTETGYSDRSSVAYLGFSSQRPLSASNHATATYFHMHFN